MQRERIIWWTVVIGVMAGTIGLIAFLAIRDSAAQNSGRTVGAATTTVKAGEWTKGPDNAKVTVIEYSDFQCPACAFFFRTSEPVLSEFPDDVRFVYRNYPLSSHKNANVAARAAEAAGLQNKFWEMHDKLFSTQSSWQGLSADKAKQAMLDKAKELGLNEEQFAKDIESSQVRQAVADDMASGDAAGITGTPMVIVNGKIVTNPASAQEFRDILTNAKNQ